MIEIPIISHQMIVAAALFFAMLLVGVVVYAKANPVEPYERLDSVLTPPERYFYTVLSSTLQGRVLIFPKVRIADILKVRRSIGRKDFWKHFSKISQKHIDFVLIDPKTFATIAAIELDDRSHSRFESRTTDNFKNHIMQQVGIPLHRFKVKRRYNRAEILEALNPSLNIPTITK